MQQLLQHTKRRGERLKKKVKNAYYEMASSVLEDNNELFITDYANSISIQILSIDLLIYYHFFHFLFTPET